MRSAGGSFVSERIKPSEHPLRPEGENIHTVNVGVQWVFRARRDYRTQAICTSYW